MISSIEVIITAEVRKRLRTRIYTIDKLAGLKYYYIIAEINKLIN